jgi:ABC-type enterochelin transport system substrate-binding protein
MKRASLLTISAAVLLAACGSDDDTAASESSLAEPEKAAVAQRTSEIQSPVQISYRVIGTPIVGQPVALDLQFKSSFGATPYKVTYRVNDETALQLSEAQSASVSISPSAENEQVAQQVTLIPLREGRLYLNIAAVIETDNGSMQTVTAVPIQVGAAAPREIIENGEVTTDEDGNLIRSLPAKEE